MKVETTNLKTVKNFANNNKVTTAYIYKLIGEKKIEVMMIDGVMFIDTSKFPRLPNR